MLRYSLSAIPILLFLFAACSRDDGASLVKPDPTLRFPSAADLNVRLGKGINLGNALDAPVEGEWGVVLKQEYFQWIADSGFQTVRLPVRWSSHAAEAPPYAIDTAFLERVAWAVDRALEKKLNVVLDMHHYDALMADPEGHQARFLALWRQVARRFAEYPAELVFDLLNEPRGKLDAAAWNRLVAETIAMLRKEQKGRVLMVGTSPWGGIEGLARLEVPADSNLILTVHYYEPHAFTHQGADFDSAFKGKTGVTWRATAAQRAVVDQHVKRIGDWAQSRRLPVFIGEFGTYRLADSVSRALYTEYVSNRFTKAGFSWALWNFSSDFGLYDDSAGAWRSSLVKALIRPGGNPILDSILASDKPIDLGRFVVIEDFEDSLGGLPSLSRQWHDRQGHDYAKSKATWYAYYSDTSTMTLPEGSRLFRWQEVRDGARYNFPEAEGAWGYDGKGIHLKGRLQGSGYPYIGFGAGVRGGWDSVYVDLSKVTAFQFRAKGRGEWILQVVSDSAFNKYPPADNWGQLCAAFTPGPEWQDFVIPVETLAPKAWSKQAAAGLAWEDVRDKIIAVEFMNSQVYGLAPDDSLEIQLDDIRLIGVDEADLGL